MKFDEARDFFNTIPGIQAYRTMHNRDGYYGYEIRFAHMKETLCRLYTENEFDSDFSLRLEVPWHHIDVVENFIWTELDDNVKELLRDRCLDAVCTVLQVELSILTTVEVNGNIIITEDVRNIKTEVDFLTSKIDGVVVPKNNFLAYVKMVVRNKRAKRPVDAECLDPLLVKLQELQTKLSNFEGEKITSELIDRITDVSWQTIRGFQ